MSIQELLESAQLDALGLLDEQDREAFERAFAAAPAALQVQLRREQARLCQIDALLPEVELPDTLWPKVRDAVREAQTAAAVAAVSGEASRVHAGADRTARALPMTRSLGVNRLWRAAAIGFATAATVLGGAVVHLRMTAEQNIAISTAGQDTKGAIDAIGREFIHEQLFGVNVNRHVMTDVKHGNRQAAAFTSPEWESSVVLYCRVAVPEGHTLRLVELDDQDQVVNTFETFASNGSLETRKIKIGNAEPKRLALVSAPKGQPSEKGEIVMRMA